MKKIIYSLLIALFLYSCEIKEVNKIKNDIINIEAFKAIDSAYFDVPKTVKINFNTHVSNYISNDSLCVVNVSAGCVDNHLYVYNMNKKSLSDSIGFPAKEELRDFIFFKGELLVLLNDYSRNISKIIKYNLQLKQKTDSIFVFKGKNGEYIFVNKFFKPENYDNQKVYFLMTTGVSTRSVFPLVGYVDIEKRHVSYLKCWYPFIKDINSKEYFVNDNFTINHKLFVSYESTPFCSQVDMHTSNVEVTKMNSLLLDSLFKSNEDSLKDILKLNYFYYDNNQEVVIENKLYIIRHLSLDEQIYGSDFELISLIDTNLICQGEQLLYYFKNRERFLSIAFAKRYNDSLNLSCYVYNNKLIIKKGAFVTYKINRSVYFNELYNVRMDIEKQLNATCPNIVKENEVKNIKTSICGLNDFLKERKLFQNKKNLLIVSLNTCPTCVNNLISWYYKNKILFSDDFYVLVAYENNNDLQIINDLYKKYENLDKLVKMEKTLYFSQYFNFDKPFLLIKNINMCEKSEVLKFENSETDSLQQTIIDMSGIVRILKK